MEEKTIKLSDTDIGDEVIIKEILSTGLNKQRLLDLGFVPDTTIFVLRDSPLGEPRAYFIRDTCIALRKEESEKIIVYKKQ